MTYTRKEILDKTEELAKMIANTEEVAFFKRAEEQINENKKVAALMGKIKNLQKEAVNLRHYGKHEALKETEAKIDQLMKELDDIPIVQEFKQSQLEVNDILQMVSHTITNTVTEEIIVSTGGDVLAGTTGSATFPGSCPTDGCER
ncbi:RicAFT regulatory complex protein RicA family protein [Fictibacillus sp. Mic-4]|uniref:RicAFT regulatory complex protein RicA family protein n=1 Tax=Fictibacillus TaxID=1329200 RepID=UPI000403E8EC|nr:RicAFT regulatory complex protein RicA family protein [Fictibacillus gelatini]